MSWFMDVAKAINPRINPGEPSHVFKWRQAMAAILFLTLILSFGDFARGMGWLEYVGVSGYATNQQLIGFDETLKELRIGQLEEQLDRVRIRQCNALRMNNQLALEATRVEMNILLRTYRRVATYDYRVKGCDELLVQTN